MIKFRYLLFCLFLFGCSTEQEDKTKHLFVYKAKIVSDLVLVIDTNAKDFEAVPKAIADGFDKIIRTEYLPDLDSTDKALILQGTGFQEDVQKIKLKTGFELYILHLQSLLSGNYFYSFIWNNSEKKITGKNFGWFAEEYMENLPFQLLKKPYVSFDDSLIVIKSFAKNGNVYFAQVEHYLDYEGKNKFNVESSSMMVGGKPELVTRKFDPKTKELTTFVGEQKVGIVKIIEQNGRRKLIKSVIDKDYENILVSNNGIIKDEDFLIPPAL